MRLRLVPAVVAAILAVAGSSRAPAQESQPATFRALLLAPGGAHLDLHILGSEGASEPFAVGSRGLSKEMKPGARVFALGVPDPGRPDGFRPLTRVKLPEGGDEFIVMLESLPEGIAAHVIRADAPGFRENAALFFNVTEDPVGVSLGGREAVIPPRKVTILEPPSQGDQPWYQVSFFESVEGRSRMVVNTRWPYQANMRAYIFIYRTKGSGRLRYHAIDERM